jgi:hypothetical protein
MTTTAVLHLQVEDVATSIATASHEQLVSWAGAWRRASDSLAYSVGIAAWQDAKLLLKGIDPIADMIGLREAVALTLQVIEARECYSECRCSELLAPYNSVFSG